MNSRKAAKSVPATISRLLKSNSFLKSPPPAFYPLLSFPPPPSLVLSSPRRDQDDSPPSPLSPYALAQQKLDRGIHLDHHDKHALNNPSQERSSTRRPPPANSISKRRRPLPIVFPEDAIRRRFFRDHPFEAYRPIYLAENEFVAEEREPSGKNWTSLDQRSRVPTAEDCIAFTHNLNFIHKVPLETAYQTSISQFRTLRAEHETATRAAVLQSQAHGAMYTTFVELGIKAEDKVLNQWSGAREVQAAYAAQGGNRGAAVKSSSIFDEITALPGGGEAGVPFEEEVVAEEFTAGLDYTKRFERRTAH